MTQKDFDRQFKKAVRNYKQMTLTDRRLHYNDRMQEYYLAGLITLQQRQNWGHPAFLSAHKNEIDCNSY